MLRFDDFGERHQFKTADIWREDGTFLGHIAFNDGKYHLTSNSRPLTANETLEITLKLFELNKETEINGVRLGDWHLDIFVAETGDLGLTVNEPGRNDDDCIAKDIFVSHNQQLTVTSL